MVKYFLILLFLASYKATVATEFGYILGGGIAHAYGSKDQVPEEFDIAIKVYPIFKTGFIAEFPITENFSLVQELLYTQKGSKQTIRVADQPVKIDLQYDFNYLEVPFLIKYNLLRISKFPINSLVGFSFSYLFKADYNLHGVINMLDDVIIIDDSYEIKDLDEFDYSLLYGLSTNLKQFGIPINLEYRISLSWYKIQMPTFEGVDPVKISNQTQTLSISYKFFN